MRKLLKFIFNITYKSVSLLTNIALLLILPFIFLTVTLTTDLSTNALSLVWMGVFTMLTITLLIGLVIKIVTKTKYNAIDSILYSKEFSKLQIFGIKMLFIFSFIFTVNTISSLLMLITIGIAENISVGGSLFGSGMVISLIACIVILPLSLIFALKYNEILSTSLNFIVMIILAISFLLPVFIPSSNNNSVSFNSAVQKINYTKFNYANSPIQKELLCVIEYAEGDKNTNTNYENNINSTGIYVNFLPGQWLLAPISSLFVDNNQTIDLDTIQTNNLSLMRVEQKSTYSPSQYINKNDPINNVFFNAGDEDIFKMNYSDLLTILLDSLINIYQSTSINAIVNLNAKLNNINSETTTLGLLNEEADLFKAIFGGENKFNSLFYFGLYINSFMDAYYSILDSLTTATNQAYIDLLKNIWSTSDWREYFYFNSQITDFNFIKQNYFIPISINNGIAPTNSNIQTAKNEMIVMNENLSNIKILTNNNAYVNITKQDFNAIFPDINSKIEWDNYVDNHSNTLLDLKLLYKEMKKLNASMESIIFLPNEIRTNNIKLLQELKYVTYLNNSVVITVLIILSGFVLWYFALRIHQRTNFAV